MNNNPLDIPGVLEVEGERFILIEHASDEQISLFADRLRAEARELMNDADGLMSYIATR